MTLDDASSGHPAGVAGALVPDSVTNMDIMVPPLISQRSSDPMITLVQIVGRSRMAANAKKALNVAVT